MLKINNKVDDKYTIILLFFVLFTTIVSCTPKVNHTYDPGESFSDFKTYSWKLDKTINEDKSLLVRNIKFSADSYLQSRGFEKVEERADFYIVPSYENQGLEGLERYLYEITFLNFDIVDSKSGRLVWRGTANGKIRASPQSSELNRVIEMILMNFPPG